MRSLATSLWIALVSLGASACHAPGETATIVSWQFADARSCIDSGVGSIRITSDTDERDWGVFACDVGISPSSVTLSGLRDSGEQLTVDAFSWKGALLYAGSVSSPLPIVAHVILYAIEAR